VERAVVEQLDVLLQTEHRLLSRAQAVVEIDLLDARAHGKVEGVAQEGPCWNSARTDKVRRSAWGCP